MTEPPKTPETQALRRTVAADLSDRQQECLAHILRCYRDHARGPTVRELMALMGFSSPNSVAGHLVRLALKGYIRIDKKRARGIIPLGVQLRPVFDDTRAGRLAAKLWEPTT